MEEVAIRRSTAEVLRSPAMSPTLLFAVAAAPVAAGVADQLGHWPSTLTGIAALLPLWALITPLVMSANRIYGVWIAFFAVVALPQLGHFGEHVTQMVQIHAMGDMPKEAHGAVGALDIEWVHFLWNLWVLIGVGLLLTRFRRNPWLWLTAGVGAWHMAEHVAIMIAFWKTGIPGDPGLLAKGGDIGGGLNILRPDLHFLYNLAMTMPLMMAFVWQLCRARERSGGSLGLV